MSFRVTRWLNKVLMVDFAVSGRALTASDRVRRAVDRGTIEGEIRAKGAAEGVGTHCRRRGGTHSWTSPLTAAKPSRSVPPAPPPPASSGPDTLRIGAQMVPEPRQNRLSVR
eukprot:1194584-Prorocentrum_minimum.AAC.1